MDWFRSHHGAPTDPKWLVIARKSKSRPVDVVAVFWTLLDFASQQDNRGSVAGFDAESVAAFLDIDEEVVNAILAALEEKGLLVNGRIANWEKRQPKRERDDDSSLRVKRYREAKQATAGNVTPCNASVTPCNALDKIREEENIPLTPNGGEGALNAVGEQRPFAYSDPLPIHAQEMLSACPEWWEGHLRLELTGRSPRGIASYACEILRGWKRGKNTPQAPLPELPQEPQQPLKRIKSPGVEQAMREMSLMLSQQAGGGGSVH